MSDALKPGDIVKLTKQLHGRVLGPYGDEREDIELDPGEYEVSLFAERYLREDTLLLDLKRGENMWRVRLGKHDLWDTFEVVSKP